MLSGITHFRQFQTGSLKGYYGTLNLHPLNNHKNIPERFDMINVKLYTN